MDKSVRNFIIVIAVICIFSALSNYYDRKTSYHGSYYTPRSSYAPTKTYAPETSSSPKSSYSQKSYGTSNKSYSKTADPYNVNDYTTAEDFYDDNYDDFFDYEDAESYYDEHYEE